MAHITELRPPENDTRRNVRLVVSRNRLVAATKSLYKGFEPYVTLSWNTMKPRRIFLTTRWEKRNWFNMIGRLEKSGVAVNLQRFTKERKPGWN